MLTEEQLEIYGGVLVPVFQQLEQDIIADIARRVRKEERWTETAELQAEELRRLGWSPYRIRIEVMRRLQANKEYAAMVERNTLEAKAAQQAAIDEAREALREQAPELFETVGNMAFRNDLSLWEQAGQRLTRGGAVDRAVREMRKRATGDILNLTRTMGFSLPTGSVPARRAFTAALNSALTQAVSGTVSYQQACANAVRLLTQSGLRHIDYKNGVTRQIDTAVRNAVLTASAQLSGEIMQANIEESGVAYVQVSAHWGARDSHAVWQGKVYSLAEFRSVCGYGEPSNPDHIYSYNCRHTHYPYWPGISEPVEYPPEPGPFEADGKTYTYYQATQRQRAMERSIRAMKRDALAQDAMGDTQALSVAAQKLSEKKAHYISFSKQTGLRPKTERLTVFGYDRSISSSVTQHAKMRREMLSEFQTKMEQAGFTLAGFDRYYGDRETLEHMGVALERMSGLYPDAAKGATIQWGYRNEKEAYGAYDPISGIITFNKKALRSWREVTEEYARYVENGWFPAGTSADSIFIHEFGHRVWFSRGGGSLSPAVKKTFVKMVYGHLSTSQRENLIKGLLSNYASKKTVPSFQEAIAEAFSEYYNSDTPREFCELLLREVGLIP